MTETFLGEITLVETIEQRLSETIWTISRALSQQSIDKMRLAPLLLHVAGQSAVGTADKLLASGLQV
jgi:hypothetical protein